MIRTLFSVRYSRWLDKSGLRSGKDPAYAIATDARAAADMVRASGKKLEPPEDWEIQQVEALGDVYIDDELMAALSKKLEEANNACVRQTIKTQKMSEELGQMSAENQRLREELSFFQADRERLSKALSKSVDELGPSVRLYNILRSNAVDTVQDLMRHSEKEILEWNGMGRRTLRELKSLLGTLGVTLSS